MAFWKGRDTGMYVCVCMCGSPYLPCWVIVSEVDEVLHEPGVYITQGETLFT